ncbi:MAG: chalcone isomerase family protein [Aquabacterium sp.]|nr:chalcone isomerase family protein [Aquabacterium sp.]
MKTASFLRAASLIAALAATPAFAAIDVAGVKFEDTAKLGDQTLVLNGAGLRTKVIVKVYAAGLYLPRKDATATGVLSQPGPKSVHAVMLRDLSGEDFAEAMIKGFKANNSAADVAKFQSKLDELRALMLQVGTAKKGSKLELNFLPGTGTRVLFNGEQKGRDIPGEDFYQAILRIWLGSDPVDESLKEGLLGKAK